MKQIKKISPLLLTLILFLNFKADNNPKISFKGLSNLLYSRFGFMAVSDNAYIYVTGGGSDDTTQINKGKIQKYDIANNTWSIFKTSTSIIQKRYSAAILDSNNLYLFNGETKRGMNKKLEIVNLKTGEVSFGTDNPLPVASAGACIYKDNIYVFGGAISRKKPIIYSKNLYKYNITSKTWTKLADMPEAKETSGQIIDGKLYVIGGYYGRSSLKVSIYDLATNTWENLNDLPWPISAHSTSVYKKNIYIVGDYNNLSNIGYYNITNNAYSKVENNMIGRRHCSSLIINGKLFVIGGNQNSPSSATLNSIQVADLSTLSEDSK